LSARPETEGAEPEVDDNQHELSESEEEHVDQPLSSGDREELLKLTLSTSEATPLPQRNKR